MTSATESVQTAHNIPAEPWPRNNAPRGGIRGGRGGTQCGRHEPTHNNKNRGERRGGPGGFRSQRGGSQSNQSSQQPSKSTIEPDPLKPPPPGLGGWGSFGSRLTEDARKVEGDREEEEQEDGGVGTEAEVCFICASQVVHNSIAPCNHRTCHICALRLRALYKTRTCAHCRVSILPQASIMSSNPSSRRKPSL